MPRPTRTLYVVDDGFGEAVADHRGAPSADRTAPHLLERRLDATVGVVVPVGAGAADGLRDDVDRLCHARGVPGVALRLLPTRIECGPVVVPGRTACHACYRKRAAQHAGSTLEHGVDAASDDLAAGYGPHHVVLASGLLGLALAEVATAPPGLGGTVRTVSLVSGGVAAAATVSVDRCPRCGDRFAGARGTLPGPALRQEVHA